MFRGFLLTTCSLGEEDTRSGLFEGFVDVLSSGVTAPGEIGQVLVRCW